MKLTKVEISGFRIFDKLEDSTFDFDTKSTGTADFVSLYAPNGFGKTSFYDAVEWGMTNSISRFLLRSYENEKLVASQSNERFIRNLNSDKETFVNIYPKEGAKVERNWRRHGRQKHDILFSKTSKIENQEFQKVILSQEWISAFLMESDGVVRFEKFMKLPELNELNQYYKNLKGLIIANDAKIKTLEIERNELKKSIQIYKGENLLEDINTKILELKNKGEQIEEISLSTNRRGVLEFRNNLSAIILNYDKLSNRSKDVLDNITIATTGNDEILGVRHYLETVAAIRESEEELKRLKTIDKLFEAESLNKNALLKNAEKREKKNIEIDFLTQLINDFDVYAKTLAELSNNSKLQKSEQLQLDSISNDLLRLENEKTEFDARHDSCVKQHSEIQTKLKRFPEIKSDFEKTSESVLSSKNSLILSETEVEKEETTQKLVKDKILARETIIERIKSYEYDFLIEDEFRELDKRIANVRSDTKKLSKLQSNLADLEIRIAEQNVLNSAIENFIRQGLEIVNNQQLSDCPLCTQSYENHAELASKISNNQALSSFLQHSLNEKSKIQSEIAKMSLSIEQQNIFLIQGYENSVRSLYIELNASSNKIDSLKKQISDIQESIAKFDSKLLEINIELGGLDFSSFEVQLKNNLEELERKRQLLSGELKKTQNQISSLSEQLVSSQEKLKILDNEADSLLQNENYLRVTDWFKENFVEQTPNVGTIEESKRFALDAASELKSEKNPIETELSGIAEKLVEYTNDKVKKDIAELEQKRESEVKSIDRYNDFLKFQLKLHVTNFNELRLQDTLAEMRDFHNREILKCNEIKSEYLSLVEFSKNLEPFLQSENSKLELEKKNSELKFWRKEIKEFLQNERDKVKEYLRERVRDFFYEKLINQLYDKIDPHPDFKKVEFKPNFEVDPPRLDVIVTNSNNNHEIIPNLYYSTAQINILSLSIFLASALNSKEYDCIFIDDPIQSMDSINVLSTIDLLRSIVVNHGKQVILSTHDQNFHNLLKKKIPPELFKSKFMELESFGKVKKETP